MIAPSGFSALVGAMAGRPSVAVSERGTLVFSGDETLDVGSDTASPVGDDYQGEASRFTGRVEWVQIDLGDDAQDADHLVTPEERLRIAMARH